MPHKYTELQKVGIKKMTMFFISALLIFIGDYYNNNTLNIIGSFSIIVSIFIMIANCIVLLY